MRTNISVGEALILIKEIKEYLFRTEFRYLKRMIKGRVTTKKVVALLKELTELPPPPICYDDKDNGIAWDSIENTRKRIRKEATELLKKWEARKR